MNYDFIFYTKIILIIACIIVCTVYGRRRQDFELTYPRVAHPMDCYDADIVDLSYQISKAQNMHHLRLVLESVNSFKGRYVAYQEPIQLQTDVNRLRRLYREQRLTVKLRIALFS